MADTNADGAVVLDVNLDTSATDKELSRLKRSILKLQSDITVKKGTQDYLLKDLDKVDKRIREIEKEIKEQEKTRPADQGLKDQLNEFTAEAERLSKTMLKNDELIENMTRTLDGTKTAYANLAREAQETATQTENISKAAAELEDAVDISDEVAGNNTLGDAVAGELDQAMGPVDDIAIETGKKFVAWLKAAITRSGDMKEAGESLVQTLRQATLDEQAAAKDAGREVGEAVTEGVKEGEAETGDATAETTRYLEELGQRFESTAGKGNSLWKTISGKLVKGLKDLASHAGKAASSLFKIGDSSGNTNINFKKGITTMLKYGFGIRSLYSLFNKLRNSLTDAYEDLAAYDSTVNASISSVKSSLSTLKNSLATAFAPIVNVVAPILADFINMLADAITYVGMFFATLTGATSYTKAKQVTEDYAGSLDDVTDSANSAADAVNNLSGLDEIQLYNSGSSGSSGSGSSGSGSSGASDLFETVEIEPWSFDSWGEAFNSFLDYLLTEGAPALEEILDGISTTVNDWSTAIVEMFTFPGVQDKIAQLGVDVAEALNGFVDDIDWETMGQAIGSGLDTAINFGANVLSTFDFTNLGSSLATAVNGAIEAINWKNLGTLLWECFSIGWEVFVGFITTLDVEAVKQAGLDVIDSFIGGLNDTLENTEWSEIGTQLSGLIEAALDWAKHAADTVEWEELGHAIADLALSIDWVGIATSIVETMASIIGGLGTAVWTALQDIGPSLSDWASETGEKILQTFQALFKNIASIFTEGVSPAEAWKNFKMEVSAIWADDDETEEIHTIFTKGPEVTEFSIEADASTTTDFSEFNEEWQELVNDPTALMKVDAETGTVEEKAEDIIDSALHSPLALSTNVNAKNGEMDPEAAVAILGEGKSVDRTVNIKDGTQSAASLSALSAEDKTVRTTVGTKMSSGNWSSSAYNASINSKDKTVTTTTKLSASGWSTTDAKYKALAAENKTATTTTKLSASGWSTSTAAYKALIASTHTVTINTKLGDTVPLKRLVSGVATLKVNAGGTIITGATMSVAARGGIINAATLFGGFGHTLLAGEAGKEAIVPLERHTEWADIVATQMAGKLAQTRGQTSLSGLFTGLKNSIASVFKEPFDGISTALNRIGTVVKVPPVVTRPINMPPIPALAQGAVIPSNREFLAVLGDQNNGKNLEAPESLIRQIMREELANTKSGGNTYDVNITARGSSLLQFILSEGKAQQTRTGKNPFELA